MKDTKMNLMSKTVLAFITKVSERYRMKEDILKEMFDESLNEELDKEQVDIDGDRIIAKALQNGCKTTYTK